MLSKIQNKTTRKKKYYCVDNIYSLGVPVEDNNW